MRKKNNNDFYYYGSEAHDYNFGNDYADRVEKRSFERSNSKTHTKSKALPALFWFLSLIFVCCLGVLYSFCAIKAKAHFISDLQQKLKDLKSYNLELEEELSEKFDLGKVKNIAEAKLGMHKPMQYQIVYIKKPTQNYTIIYKDTKDITKNQEKN